MNKLNPNTITFESVDDFIEQCIVGQKLTRNTFIPSIPYSIDLGYPNLNAGIGLDITYNNMMQEFVVIKNTTVQEVQKRVVEYFDYKLISKELLSEVLSSSLKSEFPIKRVSGMGEGFDKSNLFFVGLRADNVTPFNSSINIYELANMCKKWAHSKGLAIASWESITNEYCYAEIDNKDSICIHIEMSSVEHEAIFKACQWILDQRK